MAKLQFPRIILDGRPLRKVDYTKQTIQRVNLQTEEIVDYAIGKLKRNLERTFQDSAGDSAFSDAVVFVDKKKKVGREGIWSFNVDVWVGHSGSGEPHVVWNVLDQGRAPYIAKKFVIPVLNNQPLRTSPFSLDTKPSGKKLVQEYIFRPGSRVEGFPARKFYDRAVEETRTSVRRYIASQGDRLSFARIANVRFASKPIFYVKED